MGEPQQLGLIETDIELPANLPVLSDEEVEARNKRYLQAALRETAVARWTFNCPPMLQETDWSHPDIVRWKKQHEAVLNWQFGKKGILASGETGRGKSRSLWALMKRLAEEGYDIRYFTAAEFFSNIDQRQKYGRDEAGDWVKAVAKVKIVYIDDYGQEPMQQSKEPLMQGHFFSFLDIRLGMGLPLFLTTNLSAVDLAGQQTKLRSNPLIRRLLELTEPVKFE
jgi:DNA replication protein DnaC